MNEKNAAFSIEAVETRTYGVLFSFRLISGQFVGKALLDLGVIIHT